MSVLLDISELRSLIAHHERSSLSRSELDKLVAQHWEQYDAGFYSYRFEDESDAAIIDVPNAFRYVSLRNREYHNVLRSLARFCWLYANERARTAARQAIIDGTTALFRSLFADWSGYLASHLRIERGPHGDVQHVARLGGDVDVDVLLDCIREAGIRDKDSRLYQECFGTWISADQPEECISYLEFALRVRLCPSDLDLYQDRFVVDAVFDRDLLSQATKAAMPLLIRLNAEVFRSAIEAYLLQ